MLGSQWERDRLAARGLHAGALNWRDSSTRASETLRTVSPPFGVLSVRHFCWSAVTKPNSLAALTPRSPGEVGLAVASFGPLRETTGRFSACCPIPTHPPWAAGLEPTFPPHRRVSQRDPTPLGLPPNRACFPLHASSPQSLAKQREDGLLGPPLPGAGVRPGCGALPPRGRAGPARLPRSLRAAGAGTSLPSPCPALRQQRCLPESRYVPSPAPPQALPVAGGLAERWPRAGVGGRWGRAGASRRRAGGKGRGWERGRQGRSRTLTLQSPPGGQAEGDGPHDDASASTALQRSHQREADAPGVALKWQGRPARPDPGGCLPQASPSLLLLPLPPRRRSCSRLPPAAAPGRSPASHPAISDAGRRCNWLRKGRLCPAAGHRPAGKWARWAAAEPRSPARPCRCPAGAWSRQPSPGSGHLPEEAGFKCDLASSREISLRGVKTDFFAPRSLVMLQVRRGWGEGWRAASLCPQRSSQMTRWKMNLIPIPLYPAHAVGAPLSLLLSSRGGPQRSLYFFQKHRTV